MGGGWRAWLHRAVDALDRRAGGALRSTPLLARAWVGVLDAAVARQSDRLYMRKEILPPLARARPQRILFVGVRGYTRGYAGAFRGLGVEFWTADIDPAAAEHGAPNRHVTEDLRDIDRAFPPGFFEVAMVNGVFGWGLDRPEDMDRALAAVAAVLKPQGLLLLGWNTGRVADPDTLAAIALFTPAAFGGLPQRKKFPDVTHVYAWYRRKS